MDGSNGKSHELLERIANGIGTINDKLETLTGRVDVLTDRVDGLTGRVDALTDRVEKGFAQVNGRLDNMIVYMGGKHSDHEKRIQALEERVFKKPAND